MSKYDNKYFNAVRCQAARDMTEDGVIGFHLPLPYGDYGYLKSGYADYQTGKPAFEARSYTASK